MGHPGPTGIICWAGPSALKAQKATRMAQHIQTYGWRLCDDMSHAGMDSEIYKHRGHPNHRIVVDEGKTWTHYRHDVRNVGGTHKRAWWGEELGSGAIANIAGHLERFHAQ